MNTLANGNMCKRRKVFSFNSELYKVTGGSSKGFNGYSPCCKRRL